MAPPLTGQQADEAFEQGGLAHAIAPEHHRARAFGTWSETSRKVWLLP